MVSNLSNSQRLIRRTCNAVCKCWLRAKDYIDPAQTTTTDVSNRGRVNAQRQHAPKPQRSSAYSTCRDRRGPNLGSTHASAVLRPTLSVRYESSKAPKMAIPASYDHNAAFLADK